MEKKKWKIAFSWIQAHAGYQGNELADKLANEATNDRDMPECYNRFPQSSVRRELREHSIT
jgi:ribonuclease HI